MSLAGEGGYSPPAFVLLFLMLFVLVLVGANLVVVWYAKGAVRASLDDGARFGALEGNGSAECIGRAQESVNDLLGPAGAQIQVSCQENGDVIEAVAIGSVPFLLQIAGPVSDFDISHTAVIAREPGVE